MKKLTYKIEELTCVNCGNKIECEIQKLPGVENATLSVVGQSLKIEVNDDATNIHKQIQDIANRIEPGTKFIAMHHDQKHHDHAHDRGHDHEHESGTHQRIILFGGLLLFGFGLLTKIEWLYLACFILTGSSVFIKAGKMLLKKDIMNEYFLMSLATLGAIFLHEYVEAAAVMLFYQAGETIQHRALDKSRHEVLSLLENTQSQVRLESDELCEPEQVSIGSIIKVYAGEKILLDSVLLSAIGVLDQSSLTGESMPVTVKQGQLVFAGAVNTQSTLLLKTVKDYDHSSLKVMVDLIENSLASKSKTERLMTRFARLYTPVVVLIALFLAFVMPMIMPQVGWQEWLQRSLIFLVASCPCAILLSTPLTYFAGIGKASRHGVLIKNSQVFQDIGKIEHFFFDKTQTLTTGKFKIEKIEGDQNILPAVLALETNSTHPLARSIVSELSHLTPATIEQVLEIAGQGMQAMFNQQILLVGNQALLKAHGIDVKVTDSFLTPIYVGLGSTHRATIYLVDSVKPKAKAVLDELQGKKMILSGDKQIVVDALASQLQIQGIGECLPQDKANLISQQPNSLFVGDGFNDSLAMSESTISVAMGALGSDMALNVADVVLVDDHLEKLVFLQQLGKKTQSIAWMNILFAVGVKLLVLILGSMGYSTMFWAVFADVGVSIITILNALRIML